MNNFSSLLSRLGFRLSSPTYGLDERLYSAVQDLAVRERRQVGEVVSEFVLNGLDRRFSQDDLLRHWQALTMREQQISALACLGYTNRQIGARLGISSETAKTHLHNALLKFNLHTRSELHQLLSQWDFSEWDPNG